MATQQNGSRKINMKTSWRERVILVGELPPYSGLGSWKGFKKSGEIKGIYRKIVPSVT
jgi:hypothetical protein